MKCADPILCYLNSKGNRVLRNFSYLRSTIGGIPHDHIVFDCGKCLHCRKKKALELATRCVLHSSLYKENCFLTLTYDEKKDGYHNNFQYEDIQKFKKRLRQKVFRDFEKKIEVFNVHEYGKKGKKHWHLIVFNYRPPDARLYTTRNGIPYYISETLESLWKFGIHSIGDVTEASAMYQAQYMEKDFKHYNNANERKSHSKHSGLGRPYFEKHYRQLLSLGFIPFGGKKISLPRYFEKLAHKHFCHYYDPQKFVDTSQRKALYRPFLLCECNAANKEIADLFIDYKARKNERIDVQVEEWNEVIERYLQTGDDPDFIKAASNNLYDLRNKQKTEQF